MADGFVKMNGDGESSSKCRKARRRRIEMRQLSSANSETAPLTAIESGKKRESDVSDFLTVGKRRRPSVGSDPPLSSPSPSSSSSSGKGVAELTAMTSGLDPVMDHPIGFGSVALCGRSRDMEDAVSVRPLFFRTVGGSPLHFFAVFDGHGGSHVSKLCKERMHVLLAEELRRLPELNSEALSAALKRCYGRMDELALLACACGWVGRPHCGCERSGFKSEIVGSTAVVAVVDRNRIIVANCGDSRAVLSRGGKAVPMSDDHKPDRPDELARIVAAGGRVIYLNGARVNGMLAMSRALGDKYFKPVVISEPEITIMERHPQDECLVIASDGLWDVISNDLACNVARECLEEKNPTSNEGDPRSSRDEADEHPSKARCNLAAALLGRLALARKSTDNVSVIVLDLRSG